MISGGEKADGSPQGSVEIFLPGHGQLTLLTSHHHHGLVRHHSPLQIRDQRGIPPLIVSFNAQLGMISEVLDIAV